MPLEQLVATVRSSEIIAAWWDGEMPDAHAALERDATLSQRRSVMLELAYEEYCVKNALGDPVDIETFCDSFPSIRGSLCRRIEVHELLSSNTSLAPPLQPDGPKEGETVFDFCLLEEIGRGSFSRVFLAEQISLSSRPVVVKIASRDAAEAETLAKLQHDNIVQVYSSQRDDTKGLSISVMPFLSRHTLADLLDETFVDGVRPRKIAASLAALVAGYDDMDRLRLGLDAIPDPPYKFYLDAVIDFMRQLASALAHTHARGILHLDIKPSNILLTPAGRPLLMDFNLSADRQTVQALAGGTIPYMSPEQIRAAELVPGTKSNGESQPHEVDARSDIFALGVVFYELLSGRHPFGVLSWRRNVAEIAGDLLTLQKAGPQPLRPLAGSLDSALLTTVDQCLAYQPTDRHQSAEELADRCQRLLHPRSRRLRCLRTDRRTQASALGGTLAISILLFTLAYVVWTIIKAEASPVVLTPAQQARTHLNRAHASLVKQQYSQAHEEFRRAALARETGETFAWMGYSAVLSNKLRQAVSHYQLALERGFDTAGVRTGLAYCYVMDANTALAQFHLQHALELDDTLQEAYLTLVTVYLNAEDDLPAEGIQFLEIAKGLGTLSPRGHLRAAAAYSRSGWPEEMSRPLVLGHIEKALRGKVSESFVDSLRSLVDESYLKGDPTIQDLLRRADTAPPCPPMNPLIPPPVPSH